jgi:hypothetical protein
MDNTTDITIDQNEGSKPSGNPIWEFMKSNNLTDKDEKSFLNEYSSPKKADELFSFMKTNDLTDKDSASFYDTYLKKKDGTTISGLTELPSQSQKKDNRFDIKTKAPDKSYYGGLNEAKKAINEGLMFDKSGNVYGSQIPENIVKAKNAKLEQATIEKDLVEQSREMPVEQPKQEGSYGDYGSNIGANILGQTFIKAADIDIAAVKFLRNLSGKLPFTEKPQDIYDEKGQLTNYGKDIQSWDFMGKAIKSFKETQEKDKELLATKYKLPETTGGQIVEGLTGIIPDLAMATMTRGKNLFSGTGKLASLGNALTGAFPRQQLVMGTARGYNASDNKGAGGTFLNTLKEGVISAGQAALFELAGITGTNVGKFIGSPLKNITAKEAINLGSRLAVFSLGVPAVEKGISEGRLPNQSEILQNLGIAGAMEAFHLGMGGVGKLAKKITPTDEAKAIKQINDVRNVAALDNFMKATPDVIDNLVKSDKSAEDLNLAAMDAIKRAEDMADGEEKSKVLKTAQDLTYLANIKKITELIANSPDALSHFADDLPADVRDSFMQKAKDIHVAFNPAEQQKQSHVDTIAQAENAIKQNEALASPTNPNVKERLDAQREIEKAKATIDQATKDFNKTSDEQEQQKQALEQVKLAQQQAPPIEEVAVTEEVKPTEPKEQVKPNLEEEYNSKTVDELIALKKKLYPNPDIETAMTPEEKLLDKVIAKKFSEKNQDIIAKRKIAAEEVKPTEGKEEVKTYNAKDLKDNPKILEEDKDYHTISYPKSFKSLYTNMLGMKSEGHENAKIGDVINIFNKDYVVDGFMENKKNPNETKVHLIRVDENGNLLREQDLSKKEQEEGKAKEFEEEEFEEEIEKGGTPQVKPISEFKVGDKFVFATDKGGGEHTIVSIDKNGIVEFKSKGSRETSSASEIQRLGNDLALLKSDWDKGIRPNESEFEGSRFKSKVKPTKEQIDNLTKELLKVDYADANPKENPESAEDFYQEIAKKYLENNIDIVKTVDYFLGKDNVGKIIGKQEARAEVTQDDLKKAEAKFAAAKDKFEKAKAKVEASQVTQRGMFGGEQKGMFAMGGEEAKNTLDPLRIATKEAKAELDDIRNRIKVQEEAQQELKPVEKAEEKQKPFKSSQGHSVELENGKLIVKDKKGEVLSDRASKKAIEEYADNFDYSKGEKAPEIPNEITNSRDAAKYVIDESNNPEEIAQVYASEDLVPKESNPKFQAIAEHGLGRIKTSSYKNLGDPNKIEKSMYLKIFSQEKGLPIDVVAKSISDKYEGLNIEPKDIVDYIEKYSRGDKGALEYEDTDVALQAKDKFNKLTGLDLTPELANKVLDKQLEKANQEQLDIIKEDYETAKQLEDAYWAEYEKTDGFTKESPVSKVNEPKTAPKEKVTISEESIVEEPEGTMITHAANKETRKQLGLEQPELISNLTDEERYVKAQEMIKKGYDINKLIDKMYNPEEVLNPLENAITSLYKQALNAEAKKNPSDENLALGKRLLDARDQANSRSGAALQSLKGEAPKDTLLDFYVNKMEDNSVDVLTDKQKEEVRADYEAIKTKMDIVEAKNKELEKLNVELLAQKAIDEQKAEKKKAPTTGKRDYAAERKDVIDSIKAKLKKARTGQSGITSVPVPYAKELIEIAPDVTKLAKLYIEEGVEKLEDIVSKVHAALKDDIDGLKKEDIKDVLAGKYGKPNRAKTEIERKLIDLKTEAKLISQIEDARQLKPRTEKERVEQNKTLTDLRKELNKVRRETGYYDESMLKSLIEKNKRETQDLQDKIQKGDFKEEEKPVSRIENPELKKKYPELFNEWLDAKDAKDEQQHKYDLKRVEEQINALSTRKRFVAKAKIFGEEGLNTVKALKAGVDNSAVFVQSAIAVLNPMNYKATFRALVAQTQDFFSETRARRRVVEVHENKKLWALIEKSGLDYLDPKGYNKAMRDEQFGGRNWLERKIKIGNKEIQIAKYTTAPFERLFTSFSNEFRLQLFLRGAAELAKQGKTTESDLKYYQDLASYVNNVTGRGKLKEGKIRQAEPIISTVLWAPKLLSSTLNVLGIGDLANLGKNKGYYRNMTPQMRKYAIGQTAAGLGMGITLMAAYSLLPNKEVDSDPTSVTFGQVKDTETGWSYAIFGRYTPIVRYLAMMTMLTKNVGEGKAKPVEPLKETYKFIRGKMQPTTGIVSDIIMRKDFSGKPYKLSNVPSDLFEPLFIKDLRQQMAIDGTSSLLTKGIPAFYGLKVSNDKMYDKRDLKSLLETVDSSTIDKNTLFNYNENRPINKQEYKEFVSKRDELLKDYYKNITENGVPFINADGRAERLPVDSKKLDKESFMKAVNKLKGLATIIAKEELFGTKELTDEEREAKEELKYLWLDQNIGKQEEEEDN